MQLHNETRGFRNNNPGNIRHGEEWRGLAEEQADPDFCQFVSVEYGIRAMFKILETYREKYGLKTVRQIITRWAPPSENDTEAYIKSIGASIRGDMLLFPKESELSEKYLAEDLACIIEGIIRQENSVQPFYINFIKQCKDVG